MKNIKDELAVWVYFGTPFAIWLGIIWYGGFGLQVNADTLKELPDAITIYVLLLFIFKRWAWKWRIFKGWLVPFPNLQGTWEGVLQSTWESSPGVRVPPIKMYLVIKQSFDKISCVMFTKESNSYSLAAQINEDDDSGILRLSYNYLNRSKADIRDRSPMHDGAANLLISEKPERMLEGEYWTGRKTTGTIKLEFKTKELLQVFPE